jgi:branched-chain amino acid aminotransferase
MPKGRGIHGQGDWMKKPCSFNIALKHEDLLDREEIAFLRNQFMPLKDANVNIMTNGFLFGTGVYESLRGYYNEEKNQVYIFRLEDHYKRMKNNCKILNINNFYTVDQLTELTIELINKNQFYHDCYIRSVGYKSGLQFGLKLLDMNDLAMFAVLQKSYHEKENSITACISSWRRIENNAIPPMGKINGAYVNSALAFTQAVSDGYDDAIFLNENGNVSEGTGMNLFIIRGNHLITPPSSDNILEGITRDTLLEILPNDLNFEVLQRSINRSELYFADEIFFCGTGVEITSVRSVDNRIIGDGENYPITNKIKNYYFDLVRGRIKKRENWLTKVYKKELIYE